MVQKTEVELNPMLLASLSVTSHAFQIASSMIAAPMAAAANMYWNQAKEEAGNPCIVMVESDTFYASSTGKLYWIPEKVDVTAAPDSVEGMDAWLEANCVKMSRITADTITIPMEPQMWTQGAESPMVKDLGKKLKLGFKSILATLLDGKPEGDAVMLATVPSVVATEAKDNPFQAVITISGRGGFYVK